MSYIQLSNAFIIKLNIFKYIDGIIKKFIHNLSIDTKLHFGAIGWYFLALL